MFETLCLLGSQWLGSAGLHGSQPGARHGAGEAAPLARCQTPPCCFLARLTMRANGFAVRPRSNDLTDIKRRAVYPPSPVVTRRRHLFVVEALPGRVLAAQEKRPSQDCRGGMPIGSPELLSGRTQAFDVMRSTSPAPRRIRQH